MKSVEPRSSSSCAACKLLKRRCTSTCQFAPYFRSDESNKFAKVHKVYGASNVSKILNEVPEEQREDTVNSLVYEAEVRLRDPVYGCIGAIASLQTKVVELQRDLILAQTRLACCPKPTDIASSSSISTTATTTSCFSSSNHYSNSLVYPSNCIGLEEAFCQKSMLRRSQNGRVDELSQFPFL